MANPIAWAWWVFAAGIALVVMLLFSAIRMRRQMHSHPLDEEGIGTRSHSLAPLADEEIENDIHEQLMFQGEVDPTWITINVFGGTVTLSGTVRSPYQKRYLDDLVSQTRGVRSVNNQIRIGETEHKQAA